MPPVGPAPTHECSAGLDRLVDSWEMMAELTSHEPAMAAYSVCARDLESLLNEVARR